MNNEYKPMTMDSYIKYSYMFFSLASFLMMTINYSDMYLFCGVLSTISYAVACIQEDGRRWIKNERPN